MTTHAQIDEEFVPHGPTLDSAGVLHLHRDRVRLRSVWVGGVEVGTITDVLFDGDCRRVAGFEVRIHNGDDRFVPLVAVVSLGPTGIELDSPLHLVRDVRFYQAAGCALGDLLEWSAACRHESPTLISDVTADLATGELLSFDLADGRSVSRADATAIAGSLRLVCGCAETIRRR
jgi:hypothetical protein